LPRPLSTVSLNGYNNYVKKTSAVLDESGHIPIEHHELGLVGEMYFPDDQFARLQNKRRKTISSLNVKPIIVMFHGGSCQAEYTFGQLNSLVKALVEKSFIVLVVHYYSSLGGRISLVRVNTCFTFLNDKIRSKEFSNNVITIFHCIGQFFLSYWLHSYAQQIEFKFKFHVSLAGIFLPAVKYKELNNDVVGLYRILTEQELSDLENSMRTIKGRYIIICGSKDEYVPLDYTERIIKEYKVDVIRKCILPCNHFELVLPAHDIGKKVVDLLEEYT